MILPLMILPTSTLTPPSAPKRGIHSAAAHHHRHPALPHRLPHRQGKSSEGQHRITSAMNHSGMNPALQPFPLSAFSISTFPPRGEGKRRTWKGRRSALRLPKRPPTLLLHKGQEKPQGIPRNQAGMGRDLCADHPIRRHRHLEVLRGKGDPIRRVGSHGPHQRFIR